MQLADDSPSVSPYKPALQLVQTPTAPRLYLPREQITAVELVEPGGHANPALHVAVHEEVVRPASEPYVPPGQSAVHVAVLSPVDVP